jgi:hypothetical protein
MPNNITTNKRLPVSIQNVEIFNHSHQRLGPLVGDYRTSLMDAITPDVNKLFQIFSGSQRISKKMEFDIDVTRDQIEVRLVPDGKSVVFNTSGKKHREARQIQQTILDKANECWKRYCDSQKKPNHSSLGNGRVSHQKNFKVPHKKVIFDTAHIRQHNPIPPKPNNSLEPIPNVDREKLIGENNRLADQNAQLTDQIKEHVKELKNVQNERDSLRSLHQENEAYLKEKNEQTQKLYQGRIDDLQEKERQKNIQCLAKVCEDYAHIIQENHINIDAPHIHRDPVILLEVILSYMDLEYRTKLGEYAEKIGIQKTSEIATQTGDDLIEEKVVQSPIVEGKKEISVSPEVENRMERELPKTLDKANGLLKTIVDYLQTSSPGVKRNLGINSPQVNRLQKVRAPLNNFKSKEGSYEGFYVFCLKLNSQVSKVLEEANGDEQKMKRVIEKLLDLTDDSWFASFASYLTEMKSREDLVYAKKLDELHSYLIQFFNILENSKPTSA